MEKKDSPSIAFVGKTSWMDSDDYDELLNNGEISDARAKGIDFLKKPTGYRFWSAIIKISKQFDANESVNFPHIFITNLVKCNVFEKGVDSKNITLEKYFYQCEDIFESEIKIINPSHIVFFTNDKYDDIIDNFNFWYKEGDYVDASDWNHEELVPKKDMEYKKVYWWHRKFPKKGKATLQFLRTRHPLGAPFGLEKKIINWIRESSKQF